MVAHLGEGAAARQLRVRLVEADHHAAGFLHQHEASCDVPGREAALPEAIETAGRNPGEVERSGAEAAHGGDFHTHAGQLFQEFLCAIDAKLRDSGGDYGFVQLAARADAQALVIDPGAFAFLGPEQLVAHRIEDHARAQLAVTLKPRLRK
jgi:hypothetical protein